MKKIILLFSALFLLSCGDASGDLIGLNNISIIPPGVGGGSKVLKKLTVVDNGAPAYDINYNWSANKLVSISTSDNSYSYILEYSGTQMSKIIETEGQEITTTLLTYNAGTLTEANSTTTSPGNPAANYKTSFFYTAGKVSLVKTDQLALGSGTIISTITSALEYSGANLSKLTYSFNILGIPVSAITTLSNYDSNPNPFKTLPSAFTLANINKDISTFSATGVSANNYKTIKAETTGSSQTENTVYTYAADAYPVKSVRTSIILDFEYINL